MKSPLDAKLKRQDQHNLLSAIIIFAAILGVLSPNSASAQTSNLPIIDWQKRLTDEQRLTTFGSNMMGDSIDPNMGSLVFEHTDISLPGNNDLDVSIRRRLTQGYKYDEGVNVEFGDWELVIPKITAIAVTEFGWAGQRCNGSWEDSFPQFQQGGQTIWPNRPPGGITSPNTPTTGVYPLFPGFPTSQPSSTLYSHHYMDGVSVIIPGHGTQTLLKNGNGGQLPASAKARTASEWYFTCTTATDGNEGFIGHAPNGQKYHFNKFISRPYKPLGFASSAQKLSRTKIHLAVTRVEDQHGNFVDYTYLADRLAKIESNDGRVITLGYSGNDLITSVSANDRTWEYSYRDSIYVKHDWDVNFGGQAFGSKVLEKVEQPDGQYWEFDLDGMQGEPSPAAKAICGSGGGPIQIKHPYGAKGDFRLRDVRHRQANNYYSQMLLDCEAVNGAEPFDNGNGGLNPFVFREIRSTRSLAVTSKKIKLSEDEELQWLFEYEQDAVCDIMGVPCHSSTEYIDIIHSPANLYYTDPNTVGPHKSDTVYTDSGADPLDYTNWTKVTQPDGTTITYYHLWNYEEMFSGQLIRQEIHDGAILLSSTDTVYIQNGCGSSAIGLGVAAKSGKCPTHVTKTTQVLDDDTYVSESVYKTNFSDADYSYGYPIETFSFSNINLAPRGTQKTYEHNQTVWILGLPIEVHEVSSSGTTRLAAEYSYNALGQKTSQKRYGKDWGTFTYYPDGQPESITDPLGRRSEAHDWHRGTPRLVKQAVGTSDEITMEQTVDDNGWITSQTDALGRTTSFDHDDMGRLTKVIPPAAWSETDIGYDFPSSGGAVQTIARGNAKTTVTYDSMFRPTQELSEDTSGTNWKSYVNTTYDALGRVTFKTLPYDTDTLPPVADGIATSYDGLGRALTTTETASGAVTSHDYLPGHTYRMTDPSGAVTEYESYGYDGPGSKDYRLIHNVTGGRKTELIKNIWGELTHLTQSGTGAQAGTSQTQYFYYDNDRRLCRHYVPEHGATKYNYDAAGQMTAYAKGQSNTGCTVLSSNPARVYQYYDALGRPTFTNFRDLDTPDITKDYDANGNLLSVHRARQDGTEAVNWDYTYHDDADLLVSETLTIDGKTFPISYDYDADQSLIKKTYPTGRPANYAVDGLGRPTSLSSWAGHVYVKPNTVTYHASGQMTGMEYGNGQIYTKTLNNRLLPERILTQKPGGATAIDLNYQYDLRGKISSISDGALSNNDRSFTYDALGQLATATGPWGTQVNSYDPLGNILSRIMSGGAEGDRTISLDYDPVRNRVTQSIDSQAAGSAWGGTGTGTRAIGHDARGNVTSLGTMSFEYDYSDQPVTVNGSRNGTAFNASSFTYDGNLKRVKSVINGRTIYNIYSLSGKLIHVEDEDPLDGGLPERTDYLDFGGMGIARVRVGQGTIYTHADHLGSPVAQTYSGGALATQTRYTPFGMAMDDPNLLKDHGGFTGHIKDSATGLNYMQARYYDPVMGRFLSVDPVGFLDQPYPGQFNRYAYTWNDPINATDPDGEFLKIVKSVYNVGKRTYKNGGNLKGALKDEALSYVENGATLLSRDASLGDKAFAVFDLLTGFGDEAKGAKRLLGAKGCKGCFVAGTLVDTEDGLRPIEDIEVGDLVWAQDEETGEVALKAVTDLVRPQAREIYTVEIRDDENKVLSLIGTTDDHPWWVKGQGWLRTDQLNPSMDVITRDGQVLEIGAITLIDRIEPAFNLTVADFETYFVGENKVLVHNCVGDTLKPGPNAVESIPIPRGRLNAANQRKMNELGDKHGCHTCSAPEPGTKSGNWIGDHQEPQALNPTKEIFEGYPHCNSCKARQGGQVRAEKARLKKLEE